MLHTILDEALSPWMKESDLDHRIVLSSRIRLARKFKGIHFTNIGDISYFKKFYWNIMNNIKKNKKN